MIVYQAGLHGAPGHFVIHPDRPGFDKPTYAAGQTFAEAGTSVWPLLDAKAPSEIDAALAGHGGMHLCHHVPIAAIEELVVEFLNRNISLFEFMHAMGTIIVPSWLTLLLPTQAVVALTQWIYTSYRRLAFALSRTRLPPAQVAQEANNLVAVFNAVAVNLRYGHASTNLSIGDAIDARVARGWSIEPVALLEFVYARICGGTLLSAETSTALNTYSHLLANPARGVLGTAALNGNVLASEESEANVVAHTLTAAHNPLLGPTRPTVRSMLRGPVPGLAWSPVNRDTILNALVVWVLLAFFGYLSIPGLGTSGGV